MRIRPTVLLIALAMGVTIGSVFTPVGNPQNLLIALSSGIPNPFFSFLYYLLPPTLVCILVTYLILRVFYRKDLAMASLDGLNEDPKKAIKDARLARKSAYTILIVTSGCFIVGTTRLFVLHSNTKLRTIVLVGATVIS